MKALERHDIKMDEIKREIYLAKGYRRKDLIRQFNRMEKTETSIYTINKKGEKI